jgi:hypothetical protein
MAEERKNSAINQKQSAWAFLQHYVRYDDEDQTITITKRGKEMKFEADDVYVHFGSHFKIGINPQSKFDTPNGIYAYNLKNVWDYYDLNNSPMSKLPWAGKQPFIWVCVWSGKEKMVHDMDRFTLREYEEALPKLEDFWDSLKLRFSFEQIKEEAEEAAYTSKPISLFWNLTRVISNYVAGKRGVPEREEGEELETMYNRPALLWNKLLRECGYVGFNDHGKGIIYEDEPMQAVFLEKTALTVVDVIHNKYFNDGVEKDALQFLHRNKIKVDTENIVDLTVKMKDQYAWIYNLKLWSGALKVSLMSFGNLSVVGVGGTTISRCTLENISQTVFNTISFLNTTLNGKLHTGGQVATTSRFHKCDLEKCIVSNMMLEVNSPNQTIKDNTFTNCIIVDYTGDVKGYNKLIDCEYKDMSI